MRLSFTSQFEGQLYHPSWDSYQSAYLNDACIQCSDGYSLNTQNMYIYRITNHQVIYSQFYFIIQSSNGFKLVNQNEVEEFYTQTPEETDLWFSQLKKFTIQTNFTSNFDLFYPLQEDELTSVYKAKSKNPHQETYYAVKQFNKDNQHFEEQKAEIWREINFLKSLDHPHIIKLLELYEDNQYISLVFSYYEGGTLNNGNQYSEAKVKTLMSNLLDCLQFLHSQHLIHRDIKPQNILLQNSSHFDDIVLIDFGFAITCEGKTSGRLGTVGYVAPEVLNSPEYDDKSDVYSAGIVMFMALTGKSPFQHRNLNELLHKNYEGRVSCELLENTKISKSGLDFLNKLLQKDPQNRLTTFEAIQHEWFAQEDDDEQSPSKKYHFQDEYTVNDQIDISKSWQVPKYSLKIHFPLVKSDQKPKRSKRFD